MLKFTPLIITAILLTSNMFFAQEETEDNQTFYPLTSNALPLDKGDRYIKTNGLLCTEFNTGISKNLSIKAYLFLPFSLGADIKLGKELTPNFSVAILAGVGLGPSNGIKLLGNDLDGVGEENEVYSNIAIYNTKLHGQLSFYNDKFDISITGGIKHYLTSNEVGDGPQGEFTVDIHHLRLYASICTSIATSPRSNIYAEYHYLKKEKGGPLAHFENNDLAVIGYSIKAKKLDWIWNYYLIGTSKYFDGNGPSKTKLIPMIGLQINLNKSIK